MFLPSPSIPNLRIITDQEDKSSTYYPISFPYFHNNSNKYQFITDLELCELYNEAYFGMYNAALTFNPKKGAFTTHAKQQMRASLQSAVENNKGTISLPTNQARLMAKIKKAQNKYFNENCYNPSNWELSEILGETEKAIDKCLSSSQNVSSIDKKFGDGDEDGSLVDVYENVNSQKADHLTDKEDKDYAFEKAKTILKDRHQRGGLF